MTYLWDILGVGDTDIDLFLRVDQLPTRDEKVLSELLGEFAGGMVANFCGAASRLGAATALASVVGDDSYGKAALGDLTEFGVDLSHVVVRPGGRTYFCIVHLDASGEKALTVVATDCLHPSRVDVGQVPLGKARLVHLAATDTELAEWVALKAHEEGAQVSLDLDSGASGDRSELLRLLRHVDIASANGAGYSRLVESDRIDARALLRFGPRVGIVTLGARGCTAATHSEVVQHPGFQVPVVDTTGAGDCFNAAFAVSMLRGRSLAGAVEYACAVAALSIGALGGHAAAPTDDRVRQFLSDRPSAVAMEVV